MYDDCAYSGDSTEEAAEMTRQGILIRKPEETLMYWVVFEKFGLLLVRAVSIVALARLLTPHDFGVYGIATVIVNLSLRLVDSGMGGALIAKRLVTRKDVATIFTFNLVLSTGFSIFIFFAAESFARFYGEPSLKGVVQFVTLVILIRSVAITQVAMLSRDLAFKGQAIAVIISGLVSTCFGVITAIAGYGVWALVFQQLLEAIIWVGLLLYFSGCMPSIGFSLVSMRDMFKFGCYLTFSSVLQTLYKSVIPLAFGSSFEMVQIGYFNQAQKITEIYEGTSISILDKATFPKLASLRDTGSFGETLQIITKSAFMLFMALTGLLIINSTELVWIVLGPEWNSSVPTFRMLCIASVGILIEAVNRNILKALAQGARIVKAEIVNRTIGLLLVLLGGQYGLEGAVLAYAISAMMSGIVIAWFVGRTGRYPTRNQVRDIFPSLISLAISLAVIFGFVTTIVYVESMILSLVLKTMLFSMSYYCSIRTFGRLESAIIGKWIELGGIRRCSEV